MISSARVRVPGSENGTLADENLYSLALQQRCRTFKLLVLNRHSPCSVEPGGVGGGALHYCHGAQAPRVRKNEMRGLAIKLNGEKAAL